MKKSRSSHVGDGKGEMEGSSPTLIHADRVKLRSVSPEFVEQLERSFKMRERRNSSKNEERVELKKSRSSHVGDGKGEMEGSSPTLIHADRVKLRGVSPEFVEQLERSFKISKDKGS